jgi:Lrp/AsnC family transcriptional regulator, leucine-responsive regulatory protein
MPFTKNEKKVLSLLLDNGRIADVDMAKQMHISTQAVGKIRKKLEDNNTIEGYTCQLNHEKLGLNVFALIHSKLHGKYWDDFGEVQGRDHIKHISKSIMTCLTPDEDVSLVTLYGFRNHKELDRFIHIAKAKNHQYASFTRVYTFSTLNLLRHTPTDLYKLILNQQPLIPHELTNPKQNKANQTQQ